MFWFSFGQVILKFIQVEFHPDPIFIQSTFVVHLRHLSRFPVGNSFALLGNLAHTEQGVSCSSFDPSDPHYNGSLNLVSTSPTSYLQGASSTLRLTPMP